MSWRRVAFFLLTSAGRFTTKLFFYGRFATVGCVFSVSLRFKNSKLIIPRRSYHKYTIIFLPWSPAFEDEYRDLSWSVHCLLRRTLSYVCNLFFLTCYDIFKEQLVGMIHSSLQLVPQNENYL